MLLLVGGAGYYLIVRDSPENAGFPSVPSDEIEGEPPDVKFAGIETSSDRYRHVLTDFRFLVACVSIGFQNMARYGLLIGDRSQPIGHFVLTCQGTGGPGPGQA